MRTDTFALVVVVATLGISASKAETPDIKAAMNHPLTKALAEYSATLATCEGVQGAGSYVQMRAEAEKRLATIMPKGAPTAEVFDAPRRAMRKSSETPPSGEACQGALYQTSRAFEQEVRTVSLAKSANKVDAQNAKGVQEVSTWAKAERARIDALPPAERTLATGAITYVTTWGVCRWSITNEELMRGLVILRLGTIKGHPWAVDAINRVENEVTPQSFSGNRSQNMLDCEKKMTETRRKLEWAQAKARLAREGNQ